MNRKLSQDEGHYCMISKKAMIGDLLTSYDLTMDQICIIGLKSKHVEWSYDLLS